MNDKFLAWTLFLLIILLAAIVKINDYEIGQIKSDIKEIKVHIQKLEDRE